MQVVSKRQEGIHASFFLIACISSSREQDHSLLVWTENWSYKVLKFWRHEILLRRVESIGICSKIFFNTKGSHKVYGHQFKIRLFCIMVCLQCGTFKVSSEGIPQNNQWIPVVSFEFFSQRSIFTKHSISVHMEIHTHIHTYTDTYMFLFMHIYILKYNSLLINFILNTYSKLYS